VLPGTKHPTRDGTCIRDFVHVMDLVEAHVLSLAFLSNPPETYNVGTGRGVSVKEFIEACRRATGKILSVVEEPEARPGDYAEVRS
jgi:UDP-arabinose 4-epimerase